MSERITGEVRFTLDPNNLPAMSEDRMAALRSRTDDEIDYGDTPSQAGRRGRRVGGPRFDAPPSVLVLEPDVLQFFNESGGASASRINSALREYVEMHRRSA